MKSQINLLSIAFLLMISCTGKNNQDNKETESQIEKKEGIIYIDPRKFDEQDLTLTDFAADIEYAPLSNELQIGSPEDLQITSNAIYFVYDNSGGGEGNGHPQLYKFDINGHNPVEIGRIGRGPNEYLYVSAYAVDNNSGSVYMLTGKNNIQVFSTEGVYKKNIYLEKTIDSKFHDIEFLNSDLILSGYVGPQELKYNWVITDTIGNLKSFKINTTHSPSKQQGGGGGLFRFKDNINIWDQYIDTIYCIQPNSNYYPVGYFPPGEHRQLNDNIKFTSPMQTVEAWNKICNTKSIFETNNYIIYNYFFNGKQGTAFINKADNNVNTSFNDSSIKGIPNNFDGGLMFSPDTYFEENGDEYLAGIIQPFDLKTHVASDVFKNSTPKYPEKKKALEQLANSLDENDNPVLMMVKLK